MSKRVVCLTCRQVCERAPKQCPSCNRTTFVIFKEEEGPNPACEELLFVAALVRMGFDQSQLNRSAVRKIPTRVAKKGKASRAGASTVQVAESIG